MSQASQLSPELATNLMGLLRFRTLVLLSTEEMAVVTARPTDPFRPQVKIIRDSKGKTLEEALLVNTWHRDARGDHSRAVVEALDPETAGVDPLKYLQ